MLRDIRLDLNDIEHQGTGDGLHVFLPPDVEVHRVLTHLIRATGQWLAADNAVHHDRLRIRMAAAFGPVKSASLGYSDATVVELSRLVGCAPVRSLLTRYPATDCAVIISDHLYRIAVPMGHPGLTALTFESVAVDVKEYDRPAWLVT